ncbi:MAG: aminoacyl-tRNA hydrolase [Gemmatimonadota bacterium]|jgi:ribosome-associated protein|nr:aminoacyl-tRNA hydrolase [Gemmatimonadota bacterium]
MSDGSVKITPKLEIPLSEISFRASRSGGPGGQHVNTSSTRVELLWDAAQSPSLTPEQRERVLVKLRSRINAEGVLSLASSTTRSQFRNRQDALERFATILARALEVPRPRRQTQPPRAAREARLEAKHRRAQIKSLRKPVDRDS